MACQRRDGRLQPQLIEAAGERLGEVTGVRERRTPPQREGLGERAGAHRLPAGQRKPGD